MFTAGLASQSGSTVYSIAIAWLVFSSTGSAIDVAYAALASTVATIGLSLPAGVWADRYDRRRLMVLSDLARAAVVVGLAVSLLEVGFRLDLVLLAAFLVGAATVVFQPAEQALLPALVPSADLADANGLVRSSRQTVSFLASSGGGALVLTVGAVVGLLYNSTTFVVSAILVSLIVARPRPFRPATGSPRPAMGRELLEGMRWLRRSTGLLQLAISAGPMNFFSTLAGTFLVIYSTAALHGSSLTFGFLVGATTFGSALGSLLVGRSSALAHSGKVWVVAYGVGCGLSITVLGFVRNVFIALPVAFAWGLLGSYAGSTWLTTAQRIVPTEMQGRYFAVDGILSWAVLPVAQLAGGLLIESVGVGPTYALAGIGLLATGLVSMTGRALWHLRVPSTDEQTI